MTAAFAPEGEGTDVPGLALPDMPAEAEVAAQELAALPGVLGVFWGKPRRNGNWCDEAALCVHVADKRAELERPVPRNVRGFPTDVISVGAPACQSSLDSTDTVRVDGTSSRRRSSISAIANRGGEVIALLSGHGTLPIQGNYMVREGNWSDAPEQSVFMVQDTGGSNFAGSLVHGAITADCDYALGVFPGLSVKRASVGHLFAPGTIAVRKQRLRAGDLLEHYGTVRRRAFTGTLVHRSAANSLLEFILPDGRRSGYGNLLAWLPLQTKISSVSPVNRGVWSLTRRARQWEPCLAQVATEQFPM